MRILFRLKNFTKIALLLLAFVINSCNTLKRVNEDELLLTKNTIYVDDKKLQNEDIYSLIALKPNSKLLGYPLKLNLYSIAKKDPDADFQYWLYKKEKREQHLINFLSKKQVERLGESFWVKGSHEWLKKIGEPPAIIDSIKTQKSLYRLKNYYRKRGYFNNTTSFTVDSSKRKQRATIDYKVNLGKPYIVDSMKLDIASNAIDSLYNLFKHKSVIKEHQQYDDENFNKERRRLDSLFKNSGVYNFQESAISFFINRDTVTSNENQKLVVELKIDDLKTRGNDALTTSEYKVYRYGEINIYPDYDFDTKPTNLQTIEYKGYKIHFKDKLRYKPKALTEAIFLKKDSIYREIDKTRTFRQITNLNTFKYPNIEPIPDSTNTKLITNIYLASKPKYALKSNADITNSSIQKVGFAFGTSLFMRNVFGGAETLSLSARGSIGLLNDTSISADGAVSEIGGDINLTFPRIWFPLINTKKIIPPYTLPETRISIGTSFQRNIGLDKQTFNSTFGYNWTPTKFRKNIFELLNIQFVKNVNPNKFFKVYENTYNRLNKTALDLLANNVSLAPYFYTSDSGDKKLTINSGTTGFTNEVLNNGIVSSNSEEYSTVNNIEERRKRLTKNNLIVATNYTFTKNNKSNTNDTDFYQFRLKIESAGNLLYGLSHLINFKQDEDEDLLVFDVPYAQYIKTEFNYIKHWNLNPDIMY